MAPVKVPKKALKSLEKPVIPRKGVIKGKRKMKKNFESFSMYLFKLLKMSTETELNIGISRKSMLIMDNFVADIVEKLSCEAGRLIAHGRKTTMGAAEIRTAAKLLIPGELGKHALIQGEKALVRYRQSINS